jgi:hypothetical protein
MFTDHVPVQQTKKQPSIIDLANATYSMTSSSSTQQSSLLQQQQNNTSNGDGASNSKGRNFIRNGKNGPRSFSSIPSTTKNSLDDRLDAARAMLGISPCSVIDESVTTIMGGRGGPGNKNNSNKSSSLLQQEDQEAADASVVITNDDPNSSGRSRSNSAGLDALAFYATREQEATVASTKTTMTMPSNLPEGSSDLSTSSSSDSDFGRFIGGHNSDSSQISSSGHNNNNQATTVLVVPHNPVTSSSDDDSEIMPPPPPRTNSNINTNNNTRMSRRRSVSNPEGMDKWGTKRLRLVLPASILEEEIAEAEAAILIARKKKSLATTTAEGRGGSSSINNVDEDDDDEDDESDSSSSPPTMVDEEEENLDHDQLLRRARSRLLEDLSIASGEKGVLTLPHSLNKYKEVRYDDVHIRLLDNYVCLFVCLCVCAEIITMKTQPLLFYIFVLLLLPQVYNKNGRIGIYTPAERAAIIARFQKKRKSRMWKKKIRYNCRKNLADRRLRIKGRFVKRSSPSSSSNKNAVTATTNATTKVEETRTTNVATTATTDVGTNASAGAGAIQSIPEETEFIENGEEDIEMPDVTDPDAGFCPTDDQPYRRLRRHTIT